MAIRTRITTPNATVATDRVAVIRTWATGSPSTVTSSVPGISAEENVQPGTCADPQSSVGTGSVSPSMVCTVRNATSTECESNGQRSTNPFVIRRSACGDGISSAPIVKVRGPSLSLTSTVTGSVSSPLSSAPIGPNDRTSSVALRRSPTASTDSGSNDSSTASGGGSSVHPSIAATRSLAA